MEPAPLHNDLAEGPDGGAAYWLRCADGVRIRLAVWPRDDEAGGTSTKGTVLIFPGRTEYAEKYGRAAASFAARGYASVAVDWRGQGLADRLIPDARVGHVGRFTDYQFDVAAVLDAARKLDLPRPWFLMAHSMGGCIGLRAVMDGLDVSAAAFSAPMWGIQISKPLRPVAWTISSIFPPIGLGNMRSPGANDTIYVLDDPFEDNTLTNDQDMWEYMGRHVTAIPELALGAPSIIWLREALREMRGLAARPAPTLPAICFLGTNERIVEPSRIHARMGGWSNGELVTYPDAEHEVMMEEPAVREDVFNRACALFEASVAVPA